MRKHDMIIVLLLSLVGQLFREPSLVAWDFIGSSLHDSNFIDTGLIGRQPGEDVLANQLQKLKSAGTASFIDVSMVFDVNTSLAALQGLTKSGSTELGLSKLNPELPRSNALKDAGAFTANKPITFSANHSCWIVIDTQSITIEWSGVAIVMPVEIAESTIAASPLQIQNSRTYLSGKRAESASGYQIEVYAIYDFPEPSTSRMVKISTLFLILQFREKRKRSILIKSQRAFKRDRLVLTRKV